MHGSAKVECQHGFIHFRLVGKVVKELSLKYTQIQWQEWPMRLCETVHISARRTSEKSGQGGRDEEEGGRERQRGKGCRRGKGRGDEQRKGERDSYFLIAKEAERSRSPVRLE